MSRAFCLLHVGVIVCWVKCDFFPHALWTAPPPPRSAVLCSAVLCSAVVCCGVLWCVVLCCVVVWCGVLCCGVLWCVVLLHLFCSIRPLMPQVIRLFQTGTLMMDEVDLILHPLKSELNFPVGARHDLDLAPFRWRLAIHLLDAVFAEERGGMSVPFKESTRAVTLLTSLKKAIQDGYECRAFQR